MASRFIDEEEEQPSGGSRFLDDEAPAGGSRFLDEEPAAPVADPHKAALRELVRDKVYAAELRVSPDVAAVHDEPTSKYRAGAHARRGMQVSPEMAADPVAQAAAKGERVTQPAGSPTPMMRLVDLLDFATSPVARPLNAGISVRADLNTLRGKSPEERRAWVSRLHKDDPRKGAFGDLVAALDRQDIEGGGVVDKAVGTIARQNERMFLGMLSGSIGTSLPQITPELGVQRAMDRLWTVYAAPNTADPYGGTGLPRPWQDLDEHGRVAQGSKPSHVTDVALRGLAASPEHAEEMIGVRPALQHLGSDVQSALVGLLKPGDKWLGPKQIFVGQMMAMAEGGDGPIAKAQAYREDAHDLIAQGDLRKGLFVGEALHTGLADMGSKSTPIGMVLGARPNAVKTAAGLMTPEGADALNAQRRAAATKLIDEAEARVAKLGRDLTQQERLLIIRDAMTGVDNLFNIADRAARQGLRLGDDGKYAKDPELAGQVVEHVDTSKAVYLSDDGKVVVDSSKLDRTMSREGANLFEARSAAQEVIESAIRFATTRGDGTARMLVINGDPLELGRWAAATAEWGRTRLRPIERGFEPFAVRDPHTRKWRVAKPSDLVGKSTLDAMYAAAEKQRLSRNAFAHSVDESAFAVFDGLATREQRKTAMRLAEELGNPSSEADLMAGLIGGLERQIGKTLRIVPASRVAEEARLASDALASAADRLNTASARHQEAMREAAAAIQAGDKKARKEALKRAEQELVEAEAAVKALGPDHEELAKAAIGAAQRRKEAMYRVQKAVKRAKRAKGTADEAAARLEKKQTAHAAAKAQADAHQAANAAKAAEGKSVSKAERAALASARKAAEDARRAVDAAGLDVNAARKALDDATARLQGYKQAHKQAAGRFSQATKAMNKRAAAAAREASRLKDPVVDALETAAKAGQAARDLLKTVTGFRTAADAAAAARLRTALEVSIERAEAVTENAEFMRAVESLTYAEARMAERAITRVQKRLRTAGGKKVSRETARGIAKGEWYALPDKVRTTVEGVRKFFDEMYETLKAEHKLPESWDKDEFFERMRVEGYVRHAISRGGQKSLKALRKTYDLSTDLEFTLRRTKKGTIGEINEAARRDVAEMIWNHRRKKAGKTGGKASADELDAIIYEHGLDQIEYFETDIVALMRQYGKDVARSTSNMRFIDTTRTLFPEGDEFAAMAKDPTSFKLSGIEDVDVAAHAAGFRRVDGVSHAYSVLDTAAWPGWKKYKDQIDIILKEGTPSEQMTKLHELMDSKGVPRNSIVRKEVEVVADALYVPFHVADFVERLADPWYREAWSKLGWAGESFDALTNFFKTSVTVGALAFHGRNIVSNTLQSLMVFGPTAVSPANQMDAIAILTGKPSAKYRIKINGIVHEKTIGEWRQEFHEAGVLTDKATFADIDQTFESMRVDVPAGARATLVGAGVGAAAGAYAGDDAGEKVRLALAGAMGGAAGFGAVRGGYDVYLKRAVRAKTGGAGLMQALGEGVSAKLGRDMPADYYRRQASKAGWGEASSQVLEDAIPVLREGALAAGAAGTAVGGAAVFSGGIGALASPAAAAAVFATKVGGEGFFQIAGGIGQAVEQQARLANYLAARKAGMSAFEAAALVNKTLFDYGDLTDFERHVMRRGFPFYTWTSKNLLELQPYLATHRPQASIALSKTLMAVARENPTDEDLSLLDDHLKYRFIVNTGAGKIVAGFGLPIESVAEMTKPSAAGFRGMAHPLWPFFERFVIGVDPYYNVPLEEIRTARDVIHLPQTFHSWVGFNEAIRKNPGAWLKGHDARDVPEIGWYSYENEAGETVWYEDPEKGAARLALLRSFPPWRLVGEMNKALNESFMRGVGSGSGPEASTGERVAAILSGAKPYSVDWDALERKVWHQIETALKEEMLGLGKLQETAYPVTGGMTGPAPVSQVEGLYGKEFTHRKLIDPGADAPVK